MRVLYMRRFKYEEVFPASKNHAKYDIKAVKISFTSKLLSIFYFQAFTEHFCILSKNYNFFDFMRIPHLMGAKTNFFLVCIILAAQFAFSAPTQGSSNVGSNFAFVQALAEDKLTPIGKKFDNVEQLFASAFWKKLQKQKDPIVAKSTAIQIKDTNSTYYFPESEWIDTPKAIVKRMIPKFIRPKKRNIELVEVQYGEPKNAELNEIAISGCVDTKYAKDSGSVSRLYSWTKELSLTITPGLSAKVLTIGITSEFSWEALTLSFTSTGSISCKIPEGEKMQIFSNIRYRYFPLARKRKVVYRSKHKEFDTEEWEKVTTDEPEYEKFGAVFFDMTTIPPHQCVSDPNLMKCNETSDILDFSSSSPLKGLRLAGL